MICPVPAQTASLPQLVPTSHVQKRRRHETWEGRTVVQQPLYRFRWNCLGLLKRDKVLQEQFWGLFSLEDSASWQKLYKNHSCFWFTKNGKGLLQQQVQMLFTPQGKLFKITLQRRIQGSGDFSSISLQSREECEKFFLATMQETQEGSMCPSGCVLAGQVEEDSKSLSCSLPSERVQYSASTVSPVTSLLSIWSKGKYSSTKKGKEYLKVRPIVRPLSRNRPHPTLFWQYREKRLSIFCKEEGASTIMMDLAEGVVHCIAGDRKISFDWREAITAQGEQGSL